MRSYGVLLGALAILLGGACNATQQRSDGQEAETTIRQSADETPVGRWEWVSFQGMDDSLLKIGDPSRYALEIRDDGASVVADCNRGTGGVSIEGSSIRFTAFAVTRMACPPESLGDRYLGYLGYVRSWVIADGDLSLSLFADGGIMRFRPGPGAP